MTGAANGCDRSPCQGAESSGAAGVARAGGGILCVVFGFDIAGRTCALQREQRRKAVGANRRSQHSVIAQMRDIELAVATMHQIDR